MKLPLSAQQDATAEYPLPLENFGRAHLAELFEDRVIFRSLEPVDRRLPGLKRVRYRLGLPDLVIPRKLDEDYARVALWILEQAQERRGATVDEILWIGDTLSGDGVAFQNLRRLSGRPGSAFVGNEQACEPPRSALDPETHIYQANRWAALADWLAKLLEMGLRLDRHTVVLVDLDKTALGARGRNDRAIDRARLEALHSVVASVLGDAFDRTVFEEHYNRLNQPQYHHITQDNQDYLAYIALVMSTPAIDCQDLMERIDAGALRSFDQFVRWVGTCVVGNVRISEVMRQVHETVTNAVQIGDPTPFKRFRRAEFEATLRRMGHLPDDTPASTRLPEEITLTQEVREAVLWLARRDALVVGLSDKPDEASLPHPVHHRGLPPIHRAETHSVGVSLAEALARLDR